jgi:lipopolysaccharide export system protein LptA
MKRGTGAFGVVAALAALLLMASAVSAAGLFSVPGGEKSQEPTEILADRLVNHAADKYAEFTGAVKATQGNFSMSSDELRVYYQGDLLSPRAGSAPTEITRIVATGRVHIVSEQYIADADRVEYDPATDVLTLTGEAAKVTSGRNFISGSKITLNRRDGKALAESGPATRVKAFLHQDDKGKDGEKGAAPGGNPQ